MQIFIKLPYSKTITIDCDETTTIKQLKYLIYKKTKRAGLTTLSSHQKLRYGIKYLQNFNKFTNKITTLKSYNIKKETTLFCDHNWHCIWCECNGCQTSMCLRSGKRIVKQYFNN